VAVAVAVVALVIMAAQEVRAVPMVKEETEVQELLVH